MEMPEGWMRLIGELPLIKPEIYDENFNKIKSSDLRFILSLIKEMAEELEEWNQIALDECGETDEKTDLILKKFKGWK